MSEISIFYAVIAVVGGVVAAYLAATSKKEDAVPKLT